MRPSPWPRRAKRLSFAVVLATSAGAAALRAIAGCGVDNEEIWICNNPATGKADTSIYDRNHYVNGVLDPCHCYDPCGESAECPILVEAGPPPPGCDAGDGGP
jgi:hypothetical protein